MAKKIEVLLDSMLHLPLVLELDSKLMFYADKYARRKRGLSVKVRSNRCPEGQGSRCA